MPRLTEAQIIEARKLRAAGVSQRELARRFGVTEPTIHRRVLLDSPEPIMRRCAVCNDLFELKGKTKYCDKECRDAATRENQNARSWLAVAKVKSMTILSKRHADEYAAILEEVIQEMKPDPDPEPNSDPESN